jgi:hypothetical protein
VSAVQNRTAAELARSGGKDEISKSGGATARGSVGGSRRLIILDVAEESTVEEVHLRVRAGQNPLDLAWREALFEELVAEYQPPWLDSHLRGD